MFKKGRFSGLSMTRYGDISDFIRQMAHKRLLGNNILTVLPCLGGVVKEKY